MANMIKCVLDYPVSEDTTIGDVEDHTNLIRDLNHMSAEGIIDIEEGTDGEIRLYPR